MTQRQKPKVNEMSKYFDEDSVRDDILSCEVSAAEIEKFHLSGLESEILHKNPDSSNADLDKLAAEVRKEFWAVVRAAEATLSHAHVY